MFAEETWWVASDIARHNPRWCDDKAIRKHGKNALPSVLNEGYLNKMKKGKANERGKQFTPVVWVNRTLTDEDIVQIEGWDIDDTGLLAALINAVDTGHSLTVRQNADDDGFMASLVGNHNDCPNSGLGLSAYAADARSALKVLVYKHHGIFDGIWERPSSTEKRKYR